jgi:hypothetical protein
MRYPGERRFGGPLVLCISLLALATIGSVGHDSFPDTAPNDPDYDRWERGADGTTSFFDEQWNLYSFTPRGVRLTRMASGVSADLAWKTTGRPGRDGGDPDSGSAGTSGTSSASTSTAGAASQDPGHSTPGVYDLNGDGVFNMKDYAQDPRFSDLNGNGIPIPRT